MPQAKNKAKRKPGGWKGKVWISDDFDAPLPEEILRAVTGALSLASAPVPKEREEPVTNLRYHNSAIATQGGAYSHAVVGGEFAFLSGQMAIDVAGRAPRLGDIREETRTAMELLRGVLADLGLDFTDVVRVTVYMTDLNQFDRMNEVYERFFPAGKLPARTCVGVARLLRGSQSEIDCIARLRR